ncbi:MULTISPECIES: hypothetical protein [unclassified Azospirillum]|nr:MULTISPECIES: hypothetical protein [unclassified Azospirillum]
MSIIRVVICMVWHRGHHMGACSGGHVHQWCDKCGRDFSVHF